MTKLADYDKYHYDYRTFWDRRKYEDGAERIALRSILKGERFERFIDIGGSYGRLTDEYYDRADHIYILDYSLETLLRNKQEILSRFPNTTLVAANAYYMPFKDSVFDGGMMVRVLHHIDDQSKLFDEISRIFTSGGRFILEYANKRNLKNVLKLKKAEREKFLNVKPYQQPQQGNNEGTKGESVVFLNYHPLYLNEISTSAGFKTLSARSTSFFRSTPLTKLPLSISLLLERFLQYTMSWAQLTPAVFLDLEKNSPHVREGLSGRDSNGLEDKKVGSRKDISDQKNPLSILSCPVCHGDLNDISTSPTCRSCERKYSLHDGVLDLRYNNET
ncbi:methyltransferase domain-containing protein [Candidatus Nomurabacteria bacterium]|nr:methyltransferase domain-containing protein [Candidatus Nomurabacteria bacterium]